MLTVNGNASCMEKPAQNEVSEQETSPEQVKTSNGPENHCSSIEKTDQNDPSEQDQQETSPEEVNVCKLNASEKDTDEGVPLVIENCLIEKQTELSQEEPNNLTQSETTGLEQNQQESVNSEDVPKQEKNHEEPAEQVSSVNSQTNGGEKESENEYQSKKVLNGTIANELITEDYELPEVTKVKKHFESVEVTSHGQAQKLPKKGSLNTNLDIVAITRAYEDVRRDNSETQWAVFKYEGSKIVTSKTGTKFCDFESQFGDEDRAYGYLRLQTGDELSKRAKFLFITWVGPSVSPLKRAKMSTDKALIKDILSNFAVELQTENIADLNLENLENELDKAGGSHYGTGV